MISMIYPTTTSNSGLQVFNGSRLCDKFNAADVSQSGRTIAGFIPNSGVSHF